MFTLQRVKAALRWCYFRYFHCVVFVIFGMITLSRTQHLVGGHKSPRSSRLEHTVNIITQLTHAQNL